MRLLDEETGWIAGQTYRTDVVDPERGELKKIMLRVAYMTELEENMYQHYAASYVVWAAPFAGDPISPPRSVELTQDGRDITAVYQLRGGSQFTLSVTLPEGVTARTEDECCQHDVAPEVILRDQAGNKAGVWSLYFPDTNDEAALTQVDTFQGRDCVLAYDWSVAPYFVRLIPVEGVFTPEQLTAVAESITIR